MASEAGLQLSLSRVTCFLAVAEHGSFIEAAEHLRLAQPWVSTQVRHLERDLGVRLFDRARRRIRLTDEGARLLPAARRLVEAARDLAAEAQVVRRSQDGLRIGAPFYTTRYPGRRRVVSRFMAAHPGIPVHLDYHWTPRLLDLLRDGSLDLAFASEPFDATGLRTYVVDTLVQAVSAPDGHPLASDSGPLTLADLAGHSVATFDRALNPALYDARYAALRDAGALLVTGPEAMPDALSSFATERGLLTYGEFPAPLRTRYRGTVIRPLTPAPSPTSLRLVMLPRSPNPSTHLFWTEATGQDAPDA
ncbi:DNA-binding transcriptional LysR family regulator [Actinocorallia herbida]|uniref:DNA-binding transcriptional LysR family regulator n=1 Tax=Actinocorallia herbida TaxID=58109 RepID=A0A3N1CZ52_9ACTN|nr:LysR family transcriptional regulator [Actinocorallia herbida]ROO86506.1 DNA-binding transcriptional LysR family regulator [Actinocorallia herbida]